MVRGLWNPLGTVFRKMINKNHEHGDKYSKKTKQKHKRELIRGGPAELKSVVCRPEQTDPHSMEIQFYFRH